MPSVYIQVFTEASVFLISTRTPSRYNLISNDELIISPPKVKTMMKNDFWLLHIYIRGAWNSIPNEIRNAKSVDYFFFKIHVVASLWDSILFNSL